MTTERRIGRATHARGTVLVTGAARGIGRACVAGFATDGWQVIAGVRSESDLDDVASIHPNVVPLLLDVTNQHHLDMLAERVPDALDVVINNAGVVVDGPVETVALQALRQAFEVNVIGATGVTQAVLPAIRRGRGRIIFLSSLNGRVALPWMGPYSASKFALEGLVDALRVELRPWGIPVSLIEPSATATDMWGSAAELVDATAESMTESQRQLYRSHIDGARKSVALLQRLVVPTDDVVATVRRAATSRRPSSRYPVGVRGHAFAAGVAVPTWLRDGAFAAIARQPRRLGAGENERTTER